MTFIVLFVLIAIVVNHLNGSEIKKLEIENGIYKNNQKYVRELIIILEDYYSN